MPPKASLSACVFACLYAGLAACTTLRSGPVDASAADAPAELGCLPDCAEAGLADAAQDAPQDADARAELVAWWRAENNSNDELGVLNAQTEGLAPGYVAGRDGGSALALRGRAGLSATQQGSWVVGHAPRAQFPRWTITAWIRLPMGAPDDFHTIVANESRVSVASNDRNYWFGVIPSRFCGVTCVELGFSVGNVPPSALSSREACVSSGLSRGRWYHVGMSYDGATIAYYLDGAPDGTVQLPGDPDRSAQQVLAIGSTSAGQYVAFLDLDELKLFRGVLTPEEVQADAR